MPSATTVAAPARPARLWAGLLLTLALALSSGFLAGPAAASRSGGDAVVRAAASDSGTPWTASRMRAAEPLSGPDAGDGPSATGLWGSARASGAPRGAHELTGEAAAPFSSHGRLFFQKADGQSYSCSATVVRSRTHKLVFTAGHCIYDPESASFHRDVIFVPAYRDGQAPLGVYRAELFYAPSGWVSGKGPSFDIGVIKMAEPVQARTGGRGISFNRALRQGARFSIFGYPALPAPPYDGERPIVCDAAFVQTYNTGTPYSLVASPCDMQQGSSGGGWITRRGYLASVTSHGYCDSDPSTCGLILGPYFGAAALALYKEAGGSERVKARFRRGPRGATRHRRPLFKFTASGSTPITLTCQVDRRGFKPCASGRRLPRLAPGRHRFRVFAKDQAGRAKMIQRRFRIVRR